jgi:PAS domain S-box-containing protein
MAVPNIHSRPKLIGDLLDIIHNAIIVINSKNKIIYANRHTANMFRTSISELQHNDIFQLFMPDDAEIMVTNILHITRNEREFEGEIMLKRLDGTKFMGLISGSAFQWNETQGGIAFSIHDITDLKAIERSLKHSERIAFLGHLINDISHQIRNPIMVIGGFAKRLNGHDSSPKEVKAIINEANHLENLLDTLNNFIHLPSPTTKRISMGELMDIAETTLRDSVEACGCNWISEYADNMAEEELLVDTSLMTQALEASINNACEAYDRTSKNKDIIFQIQHSRNSALPYVIQITDHGAGISSTVLPYIFDHFYSNKTKHIGMGLTFAQRIIEEQQGTLTVTSEEDKGSTISFQLVKERRRPIRTTKLT